jgi:hypothetical protein
MDDLAWNMFNTIKKLMDSFSGNRISPCVQPQVLNSFPDGIMDFYLPADAIAWPDLDLSHPRLFDHRGIVYASTFWHPPVDPQTHHHLPRALTVITCDYRCRPTTSQHMCARLASI